MGTVREVSEAGPDPYAVQLYGPADAVTEEVLRHFASDGDAGRAAVQESLLYVLTEARQGIFCI